MEESVDEEKAGVKRPSEKRRVGERRLVGRIPQKEERRAKQGQVGFTGSEEGCARDLWEGRNVGTNPFFDSELVDGFESLQTENVLRKGTWREEREEVVDEDATTGGSCIGGTTRKACALGNINDRKGDGSMIQVNNENRLNFLLRGI